MEFDNYVLKLVEVKSEKRLLEKELNDHVRARFVHEVVMGFSFTLIMQHTITELEAFQ